MTRLRRRPFNLRPLAFVILLLEILGDPAAAQCQPVITFEDSTWYLPNCYVDPVTGYALDLSSQVEGYLNAVQEATGVNLHMGTAPDGSWDGTLGGATLHLFNPGPLTDDVGGLTIGDSSIAINWSDTGFGWEHLPLFGSDPGFFAALTNILIHELTHVYANSWYKANCTDESCAAVYACHERAGGDCKETYAYGETSRLLCKLACLAPAGSLVRLFLQQQANGAQAEAEARQQGCNAASAECGALPQPPSEQSGGAPFTIPGPCCCNDANEVVDCEDGDD